MKKLFLLCFFAFATIGFATADQLEWISKSDANKALKYLKKQKQVILFCGCCDNSEKTLVNIKSVSVEHTGTEDFYTVRIKGTDAQGKSINTTIDLAYTHVKVSSKAMCLGKVLNFECDPCTTGWNW